MMQQETDFISKYLGLSQPGILGGSLEVSFDFDKALPYLYRQSLNHDCADSVCPHKSKINPLALVGMSHNFYINADLVKYLSKTDWYKMDPKWRDIVDLKHLHSTELTVCEYTKNNFYEYKLSSREKILISCKLPELLQVNKVNLRLGCDGGIISSTRIGDQWVFDAPFIIGFLPYNSVYLQVNGKDYDGDIVTKWLSMPMHNINYDKQSLYQYLGGDKYLNYTNGIGRVVSCM